MTFKDQPNHVATATTSLPNQEDDRRSLLITACSGTVYVNFSGTAATSTVFDLKLAAGESREIKNYTGACTANSGADVRYISFK